MCSDVGRALNVAPDLCRGVVSGLPSAAVSRHYRLQQLPRVSGNSSPIRQTGALISLRKSMSLRHFPCLKRGRNRKTEREGGKVAGLVSNDVDINVSFGYVVCKARPSIQSPRIRRISRESISGTRASHHVGPGPPSGLLLSQRLILYARSGERKPGWRDRVKTVGR